MYNSVADRLRFSLLRRIIRTAALAITLVCVLSLFHLAERYHLPFLRMLGVVLLLLGLFITIFTLSEVFFRMEEEGTLLFGSAIAQTFYGYALKLSFLPLIGPTLEQFFFRKKEKNPFVVQDEEKK